MRALVAALALLGLCAAPSARAAVVMQDGHGRVQVLADGAKRGFGILPGEPLGPGLLATGADGEALFRTGDGATLDLGANTRAKLHSGAVTQVQLEAGELTASGGAHPVEVQLPGGLVATGRGAKFELALASDGKVEITSESGALKLERDGHSAELASGKSLALARGAPLPAAAASVPAEEAEAPPPAKAEPAKSPGPAPKKPAPAKVAKAHERPAPTKVAMVETKPASAAGSEEPAPAPAPAAPPTLNVRWPSGSVPLSYTVRGKVTPGAKVSVNDVTAEVRKSGTWSAKIELPEGASVVEVKAVGPDGQQVEQKRQLTAKAPPPKAPPPSGATAPSGEAKAKPAGSATKPQVKQEAAGWE